jgi:uncharacterized protein
MQFLFSCDYGDHQSDFAYDNDSGAIVTDDFSVRCKIRNKTSKTFKELTILLGGNCNLKCDYCYQRGASGKIASPIKLDEIDDLIDRIRVLPLNDLEKIAFWGGEPLLFFKIIQAMVPKLRNVFPQVTKFHLSTNGLLLDEKKLQWFYDNGMYVQISDDGINEGRGQDAVEQLERTRTLVKQFKETHPDCHISINSVLTRSNCDAWRIHEIIVDKYGHEIANVQSVHPVQLKVMTVPNISDYYFTDLEQRLIYTSVFKYALSSSNRNKYVQRQLKSFMVPRGIMEYPCTVANHVSIVVGRHGEVYTCRASPSSDRVLMNDVTKFNETDWENITSKAFHKTCGTWHCAACFLKNTCRGICGVAEKEAIAISCTDSFACNLGIFQAALMQNHKFFATDILKGGDDYTRQRLLDLGDPRKYEETREEYDDYMKSKKKITIHSVH